MSSQQLEVNAVNSASKRGHVEMTPDVYYGISTFHEFQDSYVTRVRLLCRQKVFIDRHFAGYEIDNDYFEYFEDLIFENMMAERFDGINLAEGEIF